MSRSVDAEAAAPGAPMQPDPARHRAALEAVIGRYQRAVVAFSGGVDSVLVAWAAHRVLHGGALAVTGCSPSLAAEDRVSARRLACHIGIAHREIVTREMLNPAYRANAGDRCYYCKFELFDCLEAIRLAEGFDVVLDGTNTDDLGDARPGLAAARQHRVVSPLLEVGLGKEAVRRLSRTLGLPAWDRPENACLASRLPVGTPVSVTRLRRVERAEADLHRLGFRQLRVRDEGERGRVEVGADELAAALEPATAARIEQAVRDAGFRAARVDPTGYRRGGADRPEDRGLSRDG